MARRVLGVAVFILLALAAQVPAQHAGWQHSGSIFILTTPDGANLPASAKEENFPVLVRLTNAYFNFSQARPDGGDIRFFDGDGSALPYQIDDWDAARGQAAIWVRVPTITGNSRKELHVAWGNPNAKSESSAPAVFGEANHYLSVWHMGETVEDVVGTLKSRDVGTTPVAGLIGGARHFEKKQGIFCGDKIPNYPTGSSPQTSEAWIRPEKSNGMILAWGNQEAQGKVVIQLRSPPHISVDCFFSDANVEGESAIPMSQWVHIVHTYQKGDSRVYVNGVLDGTPQRKAAPLNIRTPAEFSIGGWRNDFNFVGDIDEIRFSKVNRSGDWVRLEYENQKPMQTLVGPIVQDGNAFGVSPSQVEILEGKSVTLKAQAGGAQKVYWILKRDGVETIAAVDQFSYTFDAGRVSGDTAATLQFKAVYPKEIRTKDIPVAIKEDIPDPIFTLKAPAQWNGRDTIEVVPVITNVDAMKARGVADVKTAWTVTGGAVIKQITPDKLILTRSQCSGMLTITATLQNGGAPVIAKTDISITEPAKDAWVQRVPDPNEKPVDNQFYARDDSGQGTLYYNGTLEKPADSVFLKIYADDKAYKAESQKPAAGNTYSFAIKLKPGLIKYRVEFGTQTGGVETLLQTVSNLVCGDAYIIQGQSNALATDTRDESPPETSDWIRSYGSAPRNPTDKAEDLWCNPVWKMHKGDKAELGWWGMELAKRLVKSQNIPICIINGAVGGTRIDEHQRNDNDRADLATIYGRTLWRVQQARLTHGIRGIIWHQGENDQGSDGPSGGYGWQAYEQYFIALAAAWKQDYPNIENYYIFQIWPNACAMGTKDSGDMLREVQRQLPRLYSHMSIMSTVGIQPAGGCHYPLAGWAEFARLIQPLIERDNYGKTFTTSITPPNLKRASYVGKAQDAIALEFDQPVVWNEAAAPLLFLDGAPAPIRAGKVSRNVLALELVAPSSARTITYLYGKRWDGNHDGLLFGQNNIGVLTFCDVPIFPQ